MLTNKSARQFVFSVGCVLILLSGLISSRIAAAQSPQIDSALKPIPSGPGIQICEPIAPPGDSQLADFASGCALWLQWSMGFQPELGQTPRFETAARACKELQLPRLRLSMPRADRLYNIMGVTHVAVGEISGSPANCALTYQLFAEPSRKPVGPPIKLIGSESEVIQQLPAASRKLLANMGVKDQRIPDNVGAEPADISELGNYNWYDSSAQTLADQPQIDMLAKALPVAALVSYLHRARTSPSQNARVPGQLLDQANGNFLMVGAIITNSTRVPEALAAKLDTEVAKLTAPNNSVLAYWPIMRSRTIEDRIASTERLVRVAPNSSTAWDILATAHGDQSQALRVSRIAEGLSDKEWDKLNKIYRSWKYSAERAIALDSDYEDGWRQLAMAATFEGDPERAGAAFWKALSLDKTDTRVYTWGLEMFQKKWGGDPHTLDKVARLAVSVTYPERSDIHDLADELRIAGYPSEAKVLFLSSFARAKVLVRKYPNDAEYHARLGYFLNDQGMVQDAVPELEIALKLDPDSELAHYQLGQIAYRQGKYAEALTHFRETVRLNDGFVAKIYLAAALEHSGQLNESEQLLRSLVALQPNAWWPNNELGWVLNLKKEYEDSIHFLKEAARISPDSYIARQNLCSIYQKTGQFDLAVKEGEVAVSLAPNDFYCAAFLGDAYTLTKDYDSAVKMYRKAIAIETSKATGYIDLGSVLIKMGKKTEGRAELTHALSLKPTDEEAKRARDLLEKNP